MRNLALLLCILFLSISCEKETINISSQDDLSRPVQFTVCHLKNSGQWVVRVINENQLARHLAHGDVILEDLDGDGWVENLNECVPGGDCDDSDPTVYPGAIETCNDGIDQNCDGFDDLCCPLGLYCGTAGDFNVEVNFQPSCNALTLYPQYPCGIQITWDLISKANGMLTFSETDLCSVDGCLISIQPDGTSFILNYDCDGTVFSGYITPC